MTIDYDPNDKRTKEEYDNTPKADAGTIFPEKASRNPNNCKTCEHMEHNDEEDGHCYMFEDEPTEVCMQHTGRGGELCGKPMSQQVHWLMHCLEQLADRREVSTRTAVIPNFKKAVRVPKEEE